ncbi:hypothetical protein D9M68_848190 [compost metagenome]
MAMHVDKAGRHDLAAGVHAARRRNVRQVTDRGDAFARHAHVGAAPGAAQPIDDPAAFNNEVQSLLPHGSPALIGPMRGCPGAGGCRKSVVSSARSIWENCFY